MVDPEFIARHRHDWPFEITLKCYKVKICFVGLLFLLSKWLKWYETFSPSGTQTVHNIRSKLNSFCCFSPYACTKMIKKAITTPKFTTEKGKNILEFNLAFSWFIILHFVFNDGAKSSAIKGNALCAYICTCIEGRWGKENAGMNATFTKRNFSVTSSIKVWYRYAEMPAPSPFHKCVEITIACHCLNIHIVHNWQPCALVWFCSTFLKKRTLHLWILAREWFPHFLIRILQIYYTSLTCNKFIPIMIS